ncbi:uncharacterized protein LOC114330888 [Diabrotica virgifera virgifera]|uniref:Uncharacterized protein LOC114330888 isoform X2 n=1 Tax=Diabrotica virgifera virgifera TaxID=50390 RepID=A0A6P7FT31_DIAVI|nr:uncharacterized protein LOC114330888 [Diabrotica virgifera virgifera]
MAFILPDNILETLLCNFCHKYLSVKPVKVYPNRLMQCGRCNENEEHSNHIMLQAVESQYGKIAENILFKCINRFDGCRELLRYSEVQDHEQVCLNKIRKCPICYEEIVSFRMLRHFRSNHKDAILDCPVFVFHMNDHLEMPSVYIYQEEDNLFFIYIVRSKSENTIRLDLIYMGNFQRAKNIYHQFTVSSENKEFDIVLGPKPCTNDFVVVDISKMSNFVQIKFKLIDRNLKVLTTEISNAGGVRKPVLKNAPDGHQIGKKQSEVNLRCIECQEYCIFSLSTCPILFYFIDKRKDYLCYYCHQWFKYCEFNKRVIPKEIITDIMQFFKWICSDCCSYIEFLDMKSHELNCKQGRQFSCPIENCCEKGTANEMIEHLKVHNCLAFSSHFKLTSDILRCYAFVKKYIVYLHLTRYSWNTVKLVTETDNDGHSTTLKPHVMFFDNNNKLLNGYNRDTSIPDISTDEIFVKVIVKKCYYE